MKDKRGGTGGGGWWPSSLVPSPAAAARRVSMWVGRAASPEEAPATPPAQRPTSLVIGPPVVQQPAPPTAVQRPSCSPPPPPKSPAGSSYNTADEDSAGSVALEQDGDLLQGILDIIDKQNLAQGESEQREKEDKVPTESENETETVECPAPPTSAIPPLPEKVEESPKLPEKVEELPKSPVEELPKSPVEEVLPPPPEHLPAAPEQPKQKSKSPPDLPTCPPPELFKFTDTSNINLEDGLTTLTRRLKKMAEVLENSPINHLKEGSGSSTNSPEVGSPTQTKSPLQKLMDEVKPPSDDENGNKISRPPSRVPSRAQTPQLVLPAFLHIDESYGDQPGGVVKGFFTVNFDPDSLTTLNSGLATAEVPVLPEPDTLQVQKIDIVPSPEVFSTPMTVISSNPFFQTVTGNPFKEPSPPKAVEEPILYADDVFTAQSDIIKAAVSLDDFTDNFMAPAVHHESPPAVVVAPEIAKAETTPVKVDETLPQDQVSDKKEAEPETDTKEDKTLEEDVVKVEATATTPEDKVQDDEFLANKGDVLKELNAVLEKKSVKFNLQAPIAKVEDDEFNLGGDTPSPKLPKVELKGALPKLELTLRRPKKPSDADDSGPESSASSSCDDFTLDDATDIALDESLPGTPVPAKEKDKPAPVVEKTPEPVKAPEVAVEKPASDKDKEKTVDTVALPEDDYFELARAVGNYENVEFKRRPGGRLISKRRLHALHPPKLGAVRHSLSKAWFAMRDWGQESAKKIGEKLSRDSMALTEEQAEAAGAAASSSSAPPPIPARGASEPPPILPRAICERARSVRLMSPALDDVRASKYLPIEGQSGFDELRRYMKQGGDFCKELSVILQERSDAQAQYAKSLNKLSAKLARNAKDAVGSVSMAWQHAAAQMEAEGEAHREAAAALAERVVRPLKSTLEAQHRVRKSVESAVDKSGKGLAEWRMHEAKAKKNSFACARDNERLQDALQEAQRVARSARSPNVSDKEIGKLETKRRKAEEAVKKSDVEYYTYCVRAERARLEWETAVNRGSQCFQALEEERLQHLKELIEHYYQALTVMGPKIVESVDRLTEPVQTCDVARDLQTVASVKGVGQPIPEQLLPDFYPEHVTLAMNKDRRRLALLKLLQLIRQDLERERRAKQGVENLARALQQTPTFGNEDSQQNVSDKLHHMRSMLTYLEAARYKVHSTLAELNGDRRGSHPLASHIQVTRDRQGLQQSVLKVPPWVREESIEGSDWPDRGSGDGNSNQPDSDFDEFSSQASDDKDFGVVMPVIGETAENDDNEIYPNLGQCRALYDYAANLCDELNLTTGDLITIREKQEDGWWLGELNGVVGIFPATYVELLQKN